MSIERSGIHIFPAQLQNDICTDPSFVILFKQHDCFRVTPTLKNCPTQFLTSYIRHLYSYIIFDILFGICFDILSGILSAYTSGILCSILSGNFLGIHFGILSGLLSGIFSDILSDILSGIFFGNLSDILSGDLEFGPRRWLGSSHANPSLKSEDPHLAGGEKSQR